MCANFIQSITFGVFKLILLAALILLGVVFLPETVVDEIRRGVNVVNVYLSKTAQERVPGIKEDFARQAGETKEDAQNLYQKTQEKYWPQFKDWFVGKFIY